MSAPLLSTSVRLRRTPFSNRVEAAGVKAYTVYNHMLLPTMFRSVEEDYAHLKSAVQVWDVAAERQVEIVGPDAETLVQMTTPRDLSRMKDDQCYYIPNVDAHGYMMNDPVANKLGPDRFWISLADSDMMFYYKGLAKGYGLNVHVFEPDVSPLAIQGPKSDELIRRVFGQDIVDTKFFRHKTINFQGTDMIIARSGWSVQGGFEIYVDGNQHGEALWDLLFEAGEDLDVYAGCPNAIERIEGGLLSYGNDMDNTHTPYQVGLGKYCHHGTDCLADSTLQSMGDPVTQLRPIEIDCPKQAGPNTPWPITVNDKPVGEIRSAAYSPDFQTTVSIGYVDADHWDPGTALTVDTPNGKMDAVVREKFWL